MKIAVTFENEIVYQHFGHTEEFKIYEVENGNVLAAEVLSTDGAGHEAIASWLAEKGVDAVICGGLGDGSQRALLDAGIAVCSGASGDCDAAVAAFLKGELVSAGVNCDHHEHEAGAGCGNACAEKDTDAEDAEEDACGGCGGGCGGCHGGCGGCGRPAITGRNVGKTCRTHYRGTFNDGTQFDSSYDRGEPLEFVCGAGMMIEGYDRAVADMEVGQCVDVHLMPGEAYGEYDPNAVMEFEIASLPGSENLTAGQQVYLTDPMGRPVPVRVIAKDETYITLDANDEMAGKELNFHIELVEVR